MKILRVCLAQINPTVGDLDGNACRINTFISRARSLKADIVAFPELVLSGYPPEDLLLKPHFIRENQKKLTQIIRASESIAVIIGFPYQEKGKLFNAAALIYNGRLLDIYKKIFLPNYGVFDEKRYFSPGNKCPVINFGGEVKVGVNICEDIWHPEGPQRTQALLGGAEVVINISASPYHAQKMLLREEALRRAAQENAAFVLYCNLVGGQDELVFDGGSLAIDSGGKVIARGKEFAEDLITVDIDTHDLRQHSHSKKTSAFGLPRSSLKSVFLPALKRETSSPFANRVEKKLKLLEEIYSALVLGLKDYVQKNGFQRVIFGLSGGIDSSLTAVLAVDALGRDGVTALSMPSQFSSRGTRQDAERIAQNLGIQLITVPINSIYKEYLLLLKRCFGSRTPDITEENLQARIRGNLLMAFSNKFGYLVLTTGNKSEVSTGYCTLYGDMAGGLALLKDVPKDLVYRLASYRNQCAQRGLIPQSVFTRAPSAELRKGQKDRDTLPPYPVLDRILDSYVEKDKSFQQIVAQGFPRKTVSRVLLMVDQNEYKRRQSPPGIKITPKAFGKDRRMPITNKFSE